MTLTVFVVRVHTMLGDSWLLARMDDLQANVYCRLWGSPFLMYGLLLSSTYNLVAISVERYLGIVKPFWHKVSFTHNRVMLSIVAIWLFGVSYAFFVIALPLRMADGECQPAKHWPSRGVQTFVGSITLCISLVLPLGIHAFWYVTCLVLGTKRCLETDNLRVLKISENCSRLNKCVDCSIERVRYVTVANIYLIRYTSGSQ